MTPKHPPLNPSRFPHDRLDPAGGMENFGLIRILLVEDSPEDAFLIKRQLQDSGMEMRVTRVENERDYAQSLAAHDWDLIFADCHLPSFSAVGAIELRNKSGRDVPIIIVTGSIGEEAAVEYMLAGVEDIIIKGNWARLAPAIRRTLASSQRRREKERAERDLIISHERITRQVEQLSSLRLIDSSIQGGSDLDATLSVILDEVVNRLRMSAAAVLLFDSESRSLIYKAVRGLPESIQSICFQRNSVREFPSDREMRIQDLRSQPGMGDSHPILQARTFHAYYALPLRAKGETVGLLEVFGTHPLAVDAEWTAYLDTLVGQAAIAISDARMVERLQCSNAELASAYDQTIEGWARALDLRDKETEGHSRRVTEMTVDLATKHGISGRELKMIRWGALLHDIGKMGIPDPILLKPTALTEEEWQIMKLHPDYARQLLYPITFLREALDIPYCHHERWDGTGYPQGLRGEAIPLAARLFAVVDVWDALASDRTYRPKWPAQRIVSHLREMRGSHFDPAAVDLFLA